MAEDIKLVPAASAKRYLKETHNFRCAGDVAEKLNTIVASLLDDAARRAEDNNRGTVQAKDL